MEAQNTGRRPGIQATVSTDMPAVPSGMGAHLPPPPSILVAREAELSRISLLLSRVPVVVLYGAPGVGKTVLALAFVSKRQGHTGYVQVNMSNLGPLVDDMRRQVSGESIAELSSDAARCWDLAYLMEASEALWVLDDIHLLSVKDREMLLREVGGRLTVGRLLLTSREKIRTDTGTPDRGEVYLDVLSERASQTLWSELDELYGSVAGFETAWQASRGNPLLLRRIHAGGVVGGQDPMAPWLDALSGDARAAADLIAITRIPLPEGALFGVMSEPRARAALGELVRHFIIDASVDGTFGIRAVVRDVVRDGWTEEHEGRLHRQAAEMLSDANLAPVVRVREVVYHLLQAGDLPQAERYLLKHERLVIEQGAASEMLGWIEAVDDEVRPPGLTLLRGICLTRLGYAERSYQCLLGLRLMATDVDVDLAFSQAATLCGRPRMAERVLLAVLERQDVDERHRARAVRSLAVVTAQLGRCDEARAMLDERVAESAEREHCALAFVKAFTFWLEGRYREAEEPMRQARALQESGERDWKRRRLYVTSAPIEANLGQHDLAEETLREVMTSAERDDEFVPIGGRIEQAVLMAERGQRTEAIAVLREVERDDRRRGLQLGVWWAQIQLARNLLLCGRRREGLAVLDDVQLATADAGALALSEAARRERAMDPIDLLDSTKGDASPSNVGFRIRRDLVSALHALHSEDVGIARALLEGTWPKIEGRPGYGIDRAIAQAVRAMLAHREGDVDAARAFLAAAQRAAFDELVDADVYEAIVVRAGLTTIGLPSAKRITLDTRNHALQFDDKVLSVASRPVVRRLLYLLASRVGQSVRKEEIVQEVWDTQYDPRRHDNPLRVTIRRARTLLEATPLRIMTEGDGYRLVAPSTFEVEG